MAAASGSVVVVFVISVLQKAGQTGLDKLLLPDSLGGFVIRSGFLPPGAKFDQRVFHLLMLVIIKVGQINSQQAGLFSQVVIRLPLVTHCKLSALWSDFRLINRLTKTTVEVFRGFNILRVRNSV